MQRRVITSTSGGIATSTCLFHCHDETNRFQALQENFTTVTQDMTYGSEDKIKVKTKKEYQFIQQDHKSTHTQKKKKKKQSENRGWVSVWTILLFLSYCDAREPTLSISLFSFFFFLFLFLFLNSLVVFLKRIYGCTKRQVLLLPSDGFKHVFFFCCCWFNSGLGVCSLFFSSLSLLLFWLAAD